MSTIDQKIWRHKREYMYIMRNSYFNSETACKSSLSQLNKFIAELYSNMYYDMNHGKIEWSAKTTS